MADHDDHIHVGFQPQYGTNTKLAKQLSAVLKPSQWTRLIERLGKIDNPTVRRAPSKARAEGQADAAQDARRAPTTAASASSSGSSRAGSGRRRAATSSAATPATTCREVVVVERERRAAARRRRAAPRAAADHPSR